MGSGGGGGQQVQQIPGGPINNIPLQDNLANAGLNMLTQAAPYAHIGAGYQGLPRVPLGQVYMPGPNPTTFGDPFNAQYAQNFFGPNSGNAPPGYAAGGAGMGSGAGGASGGAGAPPQGGLGSQIASYANQALGGQGQGVPTAPGQQMHPMVSALSSLLQPGVLGQLFTQMGQQNQQGGGQQQQPQQQQSNSSGGGSNSNGNR